MTMTIQQAPRGHKLLTKAIERKLEKSPLKSKDGSSRKASIIVKFFSPYSNWTWYVIEGEKQEDGDWLFFGLVDGLEKELGSFTLRELEEATGTKGWQTGLPLVERDCHFDGHTLGEFLPEW